MNPMLIASAAKGVGNSISNTFKKNPALFLLVIAAIIYFFLPWRSWIAKMNAMKAVSQKNANVVETESNGSKMTMNLQSVADGIYDAFYGSKLTEDEPKAIALINSVPDEYVQQVAYIYAQKGKDMYADFRRFLRKSQYVEVANKLD